jgi:hypothetical protein
MPSRRWKLSLLARRLLCQIFLGLLIVYVSFGTFVWWAMHRPPETFGRVMAKMPGPIPFLLFPFETAWLHARAGTLHSGDLAPDFSLLKGSIIPPESKATRRFGIRKLHLTSVPAGGSCSQ